MTKQDLVDRIAEREPRIGKRDCGLAVDAILQAMAKALARGDRIEFRGFGVFKVRYWAARKARNPSTGAPVDVPARHRVAFQPSSKLLGLMAGGTRQAGHVGAGRSGPGREKPAPRGRDSAVEGS